MIGRRENARLLEVLNRIQTGTIPVGLGLCGSKIASSPVTVSYLPLLAPCSVGGPYLARVNLPWWAPPDLP
jgi:hypothetical protein